MKAELQAYVEKRIELETVKISGKVAEWLSVTIQKVVGIALLTGAFIFLLVALALFVGSLLGSRSLGFVIVAAPLLIVGFLLYLLKPNQVGKKIKLQLEKKFLAMYDYDLSRDEKLITTESNQTSKKEENHGQY